MMIKKCFFVIVDVIIHQELNSASCDILPLSSQPQPLLPYLALIPGEHYYTLLWNLPWLAAVTSWSVHNKVVPTEGLSNAD